MFGNIFKFNMDDYYFDVMDVFVIVVCYFYQFGSVFKGKKCYSDWSSFLKDNFG